MLVLTCGCILPKGMVGQALVDWPFLPNIAGPVHMPGFSMVVPPCSSSKEPFGPGSTGMPSGQHTSGWVVANSSFQLLTHGILKEALIFWASFQ